MLPEVDLLLFLEGILPPEAWNSLSTSSFHEETIRARKELPF
jgi:hypothetical protein